MSWGFINKKGEMVVEPRFEFINSGGFNEGLAGVSVHTKYPEKYGLINGYINQKGKMVIQPKFESVSDFCNGLAAVAIKNAEGKRKYGVIDKDGNYVIQPHYDSVYVWDWMYEGLTLVMLDDKKVYIDKNGKMIIDPQGMPVKKEYINDNPLLVIKQGDKYGYSSNGKTVIKPEFDEATDFLSSKHYPCPYAKVKINSKYGFIDKTGKYIINPQYDELDWFREGFAGVKIDGKWGFVDFFGTVVIKPVYDSVCWFSDGLAVVSIKKRYGAINKMGQYVIYPQFDKLLSFSEGLAGVEFSKIMYDENHNEWFCKEKTGSMVHHKDWRYVLQAAEGLLTNERTSNVGQTQRTTSSTSSNSTGDTERKSTINSKSSASHPNTNSSSKNGCYVATAVYGSYNCPEVWTLRRFRDNTLDSTWYGRAFIKTYYAISPTLVKWFGEMRWFKKMWKKPLDRMVYSLQKKGVESTPYKDKY